MSLFLVAVLGAHALAAEDPRADDAPALEPRATGDWGGARAWLAAQGLTLELILTGEVFARAAGGHGRRVAPLENGDLTVSYRPWTGTELFVYVQENIGEQVSPALGTRSLASNLEAEPFIQVSELLFEQLLLDKRIRIKLGKQDTNFDFGSPRFAGNFLNSSFGAIPSTPMPTFPAPALGGLLGITPVAAVELRGGIYEAAPQVGELYGGGGVLGMASLVIRHAIGASEPPSGGLHSLGLWCGPTGAGVFGTVDAQLLVAGEESFQVFGRFGWAPDLAEGVSLYLGGGLTWHGFAGRNDTAGVGFGHLRAVDETSETLVELFYKARFVPWFSVEPDAQAVVTPSGWALTVAVRVKLKL